MTVATFAEPFTGSDHEDFAAWAREVREYRIERAYDPPTIWFYDGDWVYRGIVRGELGGSVNLIVNETGTIQLRLPIDLDDPRRTWAAFWALDEDARGTSNIHVRIEMMGARICGRMKPKNGVTVVRGEQGDEVRIDFLDDIEELKYVHTAGNPFLPISLIQQPKAWMLYLQADHGILLTLAANLLRLQLTNIDLSFFTDLLDPDQWPVNPLDMWQQSQIIVKPRKIGDSVAPLALVVGSIRTSIFDVAAPILEDAEMQWDLRRWFIGDPEPWPGAGTEWIRNGTLFVDIADKSGFRRGTSIGGNLFTGLTRTIASLTSNHVEDSYDLFTGETIDETGFRLPGFLSTPPAHPYVVYRDGDITGIQTSEFSISPGGAGRITVGGQSMPGVDELISAAIRYGGDVLGDNLNAVITAVVGTSVSVGSLGAALDAFLNPIYKDSILAHMSVPLLLRQNPQRCHIDRRIATRGPVEDGRHPPDGATSHRLRRHVLQHRRQRRQRQRTDRQIRHTSGCGHWRTARAALLIRFGGAGAVAVRTTTGSPSVCCGGSGTSIDCCRTPSVIHAGAYTASGSTCSVWRNPYATSCFARALSTDGRICTGASVAVSNADDNAPTIVSVCPSMSSTAGIFLGTTVSSMILSASAFAAFASIRLLTTVQSLAGRS